MLRGISDRLDQLYKLGAIIAGVILVLMCGLVLFSILSRILGLYAGGTNELAGYAMATSTFLALAHTFRTHGHIRVAILIQNTTGTRRRQMETFCLLIMSAISAYLAFYMARLALDSFEYGERSEGADALLLWIPQTPAAIGAGLMALAVCHTCLQAFFDYEAIDPERVKQEGPNEV